MKITKRQETFILNLLDLYKEVQEPIHYTTLAERLGVSRFTAYDMLRVLEKKGFVKSEYKLSGEKSRSGRSERVFFPTSKADDLISLMVGGSADIEWEHMRDLIKDKVEKGEFADWDIVMEIIARVPPKGEGHLHYCVEVMIIILLHLHQNERLDTLRKFMKNVMPETKIVNRSNLSLLGGFTLGILAQESDIEEEWLKELTIHLVKFQEIVIQLDLEERRRLVKDVREHLQRVFINSEFLATQKK